MRRYFLIFSAIFALIVFVVAVVIFVATKGRGTPTDTAVPPEGAINLQGTFVCLPHKDTSGPQTEECAYGLQDDSGRYFALNDSVNNYKNLTQYPMNTEVDVKGTFTAREASNYPTVGVIDVSQISKSTASPGLGTLEGTVYLGPKCPPDKANGACENSPYATDLMLTTVDQDQVIREFSSDITGRFSISVSSGQYVILSRSAVNKPPYCTSGGTITVIAGKINEVDVYCTVKK